MIVGVLTTASVCTLGLTLARCLGSGNMWPIGCKEPGSLRGARLYHLKPSTPFEACACGVTCHTM